MPVGGRQTFRYPASVILGIGLAPLLIAVLFGYVVATAPLARVMANAAWELPFLLLALYLTPALMLSAVRVEVDDRGISTYWFGLRTQRFEWDGIARIVHRVSTQGFTQPNDFIDVVRRGPEKPTIIPNAFGWIMVTELLVGYEAFKAALTTYAKVHDIPLCYVDEMQARSQKSKQARRVWLRNGVPVDKL